MTADWTQTYSYDRYGNKTGVSASGIMQDSNNIPADGLPSVATDVATNRVSAFTYDRTGNLVRGQNANGVWQRFEYDAAGRLKKVKNDGGTDLETYSYGAGREKLIVATALNTIYYVWGGSSIIAEYVLKTGNPVYAKQYFYAGSRLLMTIVKGKTFESTEYHHPDRLGTQLVTSADTGGSYRQTTLPFGTSISAETTGNTNQVFTSYDRSTTTGLDYAVNRTYSRGQSRFTQVDPIGMASSSLGNPQSNNLYAYVQNMPTDYVDPSGLLKIQQCSRQWWTGANGNVNYSSWQCTTIYDDGLGSGGNEGNGSSAAVNASGNDCQKFANKVAQLAGNVDPSHPNAAGQVQNFMDALAQWATEFGYATTSAVAAGLVSPNSFPDFGDGGFKELFQGSDSPNQVRHAIGGLIVGFINVGGDSRAAQYTMAMREVRRDLSTDAADIALNSATMPMGARLAGTSGAKAVVGLADWIRKNLCEPVGREGVGRPR